MPIRRKAAPPPVEEPKANIPQAVVASAARLNLPVDAWRDMRYTDEAWQGLAWNFYDTIPQLHNAVEYIGSACSLVRIYVAHKDENGIRGAEVTDNKQVAALAETLFGGPGAKAEMLRNIGQSLTVAGELYILGRFPKGKKLGQWFTAAPAAVRPMGDRFTVLMGKAFYEDFYPGTDMVMRVWTPHPARNYLSDSPVRGLLGLLDEMASMQQFVRSQMNSRIANASILPVPSELSVPSGDSTTTADVYDALFETITSNLEGRGTAAQVAPIIWQMPTEQLAVMANVQPITFESVLSETAIALRKEQQEKLALGMNVPTEIMLGGREMNHWSVWWASEEFIVKTIAPLFNRIVDALNTAYLVPGLEQLGLDPDDYTYWYDTAPLANSANKLRDAIDLYNLGLLAGHAVRAAGAFGEHEAPDDEEVAVRFTKDVVLRDPALFNSEEVREYIGIDGIDQTVPELATPAPPPPAPQRGPMEVEAGEAPVQPSNGDVADTIDSNTSTATGDLIASAAPTATHVACNAAVIRALELAGNKMLTPSVRGAFKDVDVTTLHTRYKLLPGDHMDKLMQGAWKRLPEQLEGTGLTASAVEPLLDQYVKGLMLNQIIHAPSLLSAFLNKAGIK